MRITTDTNILISGTFWTGDSFRILNLVNKNNIKLILSDEILLEYNTTINKDEILDKIEDKGLIASKIVKTALNNATIVEPNEKLDIVKDDPDDNKILECAIEGNVDYLITNDNHLLRIKQFRGIKIITPEEFLEIFKENN